MIEGFDVKDQALGTGDTKSYTFDFKIYSPTDLLIYVQDGSGAVVQKVRGDDTTYLASLTYDSNAGGGTVTLINNLPDTYVMTMMLAPDQPAQPTSLPNKMSFSLSILEGALDFIASCVQRAAYFGQRAVVLHDLDDIDNFDPTLPLGIGNHPGGMLSVKSDGSGFEVTSYNALGILGYGSPSAPENITATGGITFNGYAEEVHWIQGSGAAVVVTANPRISPGSAVGQKLFLYGADNTKTVTLATGNGLSLASMCVLGQENCLALMWNGTNWSELFRR